MAMKSVRSKFLLAVMLCGVFQFPRPAQAATMVGRSPQVALQSPLISEPTLLLAQAEVSNLSPETESIAEVGFLAFQLGTEAGYNEAIAQWESIETDVLANGDADDVALLYLLLGRAYDLLGQNQTAWCNYEKAMPAFQTAENALGVLRTLNFLGLLQDSFGNRKGVQDEFYNQHAEGEFCDGQDSQSDLYKKDALTIYGEALVLAEQVGDPEMLATVLGNIGSTYNSLGDKPKALEFYEQSLVIVREMGEKNLEGTLLNNIAFAYNDLGEKDKALEYFNESLVLVRETGDRLMEGTVLNNLGLVYDSFGDKVQALEFYDQALPIVRSIGDPTMEATILNNVGLAYSDLGEKQKALDAYQKSLPLSEMGGAQPMVATTLNNMGLVYFTLGEYEQALVFYERSLPITKAVGDRAGEARILNNMGLTYHSLAERRQDPQLYVKALELYNESLPLSIAVEDPRMTATTLNNVGLLYALEEDHEQTLEVFNLALPIIQEVGDRRMEATALGNIGRTYGEMKEFDLALDFYNQALPIARSVGDRSGEALTLVNMATIEYEQGKSEIALSTMEQAIAIVEDLRTKVVSPELRRSYFATVQNYYQFYIKLLMELDQRNPGQMYAQRAFAASEQSRAKTLLELLTEADADIRTGIDPDLLEEEQILLAQLDTAEAERVGIYSDPDSTEVAQSRADDVLSNLITEYKALQNRIRRESPNYANLKYPQTLDVETLQAEILDENTILLQYSMGLEESYLWAVTQSDFTSYRLAAPEELNPLISEARQVITDVRIGLPPARQQQREKARNEALQALSQEILAPVAAQLEGKRILVVADGSLHYLPFSVLSSTGDYSPLSDRHEIVNLPSATTLALLRQETIAPITPDSSLAILADPIFNRADCRLAGQNPNCVNPDQPQNFDLNFPENDIQLLALKRAASNAGRDFQRLPGTRTEAQDILKLFPNTNEVTQAFDFDANRETLVGDRLQNYDVIHIATHGLLNTSEPELSGIVLSLFDKKQQPQNGFLRINDVFNLKLNAKLLVLSACETGLGENIQGEGLVGLSRGFMYAGVPRIVMSLWQVSDEATAEFMTRFYRNLLEDQLTAAAALKETQREMREETEWTHPYFWSAFILQGEWL